MAGRRLGAMSLLGVMVAFSVGAAGADPLVPQVDQGASAEAVAAPLEVAVDAVSVFQTGELETPVRDAALAAALEAGAPAVVGRGFTSLMTRLRRGAGVVQQSTGAGWGFPMAVTSLPLDAVAAVMGRDVSSVLAAGQVTMGETSASIRGAQVGDVIDLVGPFGSTVSFTIGRIGTDTEVGGAELVMSPTMADRLGATIPTRVLVYGQFDRVALQGSLRSRGLYANTKVRIRHSWDAPDPDSTLGMAATKKVLGEFDLYYAGLSTNDWTKMNANWVATYLPPSRELYPTGIRARCNVAVRADLRAALQEVVDSGLSWTIDAANANSYGGCATGTVRFARVTQVLGSVSRHSWGQPLDTNTVTNCQGCVPRMDCRVVRIFRKHGFAWGGNFLTPDGMHFEWVGEPRHTLQFPSKYCPNLAAPVQTQSLPGSTRPAGRDTMFADDGLTDE
ncbi:MAG: M15 family metallopeptidase [Actinomycetota bacterium]